MPGTMLSTRDTSLCQEKLALLQKKIDQLKKIIILPQSLSKVWSDDMPLPYSRAMSSSIRVSAYNADS